MGQGQSAGGSPDGDRPVDAAALLRALRAVQGISQEGWGARLGYGRKTIQRWEQGETVPDATAEAVVLTYCAEHDLYRRLHDGPLAGLVVSPELIRATLAAARLTDRTPPITTPVRLISVSRKAERPIPLALTPLVGRETDLLAITGLLARERLVTLIGPGGVGKTRLALAVADTAEDRFPDGAALVDLAPVRDPGLVVPALAQVLGVQEQPEQSLLQALHGFLRGRQLLLVLDNFEHLLEATPLVHDLLSQHAGLVVLATSRAALRLSGEVEYPVGPLPVPRANPEGGTTDLALVPAVALFVQRVQALRPTFVLTHENAPAIAAICRRLDGLPLAIELAAARMRVLSPQALLARLDASLEVLSHGVRDHDARHQTLRAAIAWSWNLLSSEKQALLRRLSVFVGGWTVEAAEAVCGSPSMLRYEVLDGLSSLVEQSLVVRDEHDDEPRFRMLQTIHQFAGEQLAASGEADTIRRRHAAWMMETMEGFWQSPTQAPSEAALAALTRDHDNLRAALAWAYDHGDANLGLGLVGVSWLFWMYRGTYREMLTWAQRFVAVPGPALPTRERALGLFAGCWAGAMVGDFAAAEPLGKESIVTWRAIGGTGRYYALALVIPARLQPEDAEEVRRDVVEALALMRATSDTFGLAIVLNMASLVLANVLNDWDAARPVREEAVVRFRQVGEQRFLAITLSQLMLFRIQDGAFEQARRLGEESLHLNQGFGSAWGTATALWHLGRLAERTGNHTEAYARFAASLRVSYDHGLAQCLDTALLGIGFLLAAEGHWMEAVRLWGAAAAERERSGSRIGPVIQIRYKGYIDKATRLLGEALFARSYEAGRTLTLDQAVTEALAAAGTRDRQVVAVNTFESNDSQ